MLCSAYAHSRHFRNHVLPFLPPVTPGLEIRQKCSPWEGPTLHPCFHSAPLPPTGSASSLLAQGQERIAGGSSTPSAKLLFPPFNLSSQPGGWGTGGEEETVSWGQQYLRAWALRSDPPGLPQLCPLSSSEISGCALLSRTGGDPSLTCGR